MAPTRTGFNSRPGPSATGSAPGREFNPSVGPEANGSFGDPKFKPSIDQAVGSLVDRGFLPAGQEFKPRVGQVNQNLDPRFESQPSQANQSLDYPNVDLRTFEPIFDTNLGLNGPPDQLDLPLPPRFWFQPIRDGPAPTS